VPSANTLVRWVNEYAFAFIVQARPCPTFGRPVHRRGGPHRLQPGTSPHALRIPPRDGHPALRKTARIGSRSTLAVSSFRLRARLGFSIPYFLSPGPRGITPAFGYGAPHPSARGTSTLLNDALLSAHYDPLRDPSQPASCLFSRTMPFGLVPLAPGFPPLPRSPSLHAVPTTPVDRIGAYRLGYGALPHLVLPDPLWPSRRTHPVGITACSFARPPQVDFVTRLQSGQFPIQTAPQLPSHTDSSWCGTFTHW
jgi:hypothetical protein